MLMKVTKISVQGAANKKPSLSTKQKQDSLGQSNLKQKKLQSTAVQVTCKNIIAMKYTILGNYKKFCFNLSSVFTNDLVFL